eukprot:2824684-Amphidinium_carterae.1
MAKVHGPENPADLMAKFLDADTILRILREGRTLPTGGVSSERQKLRALWLGGTLAGQRDRIS